MMNGDIQLKSAPGSGTTVGVTLRLAIGTAEEAELSGETSQRVRVRVEGGSTAPKCVVLAGDDHPTNRELLARQIRALGLVAKTAVDGREALALWQAGGIDVVVTDCNMPQMDGYTLSRAIREIELKEERLPTPIVAWDRQRVAERRGAVSRAAGMDDILTKPAELEALRRTLVEMAAGRGHYLPDIR